MSLARRSLLAAGAACVGAGLMQPPSARAAGRPRRAFTPGEVWLDTAGKPIRFDGERPVIEWRAEWSLEEFA